MAWMITGAEGMVGRNLTKYLTEKGYNVVAFEGDATKTFSWEQYEGEEYDAIIHLAAFAGVRPSMENPEAYYYNNIRCMENFLKYGSKMTKKLIYASSSNAYEWWLNPYAATKKMNECQSRSYKTVGMRFHTVFPGRDDMLFRKLERKEVKYINEDHKRDFIHVKDLCAAIETIAINFDAVYNYTLTYKVPYTDFPDPGVIDIGTGKSVSVKEVAELMGYEGEYVKGTSVGERIETAADIQCLLRLGWNPKRNILDVNCHTE